jgi:ATP-dependent Lon protease
MLVKEWDLNVSYTKGDIICIDSEYYICAIDHVSDNLINPQNPEEIYWIHLRGLGDDVSTPMVPGENVPLAPTSASFPDIGPSGIIFSTSEHNDIENLIKSLMGSVPVLSPVPMSRTGASRKKNLVQEPELTQEEIDKRKKEQKLKRKISSIDNDLEIFKKKRRMAESELAIEDQIKLLNIDPETKLFLLDKNDSLQRSHGSDYSKGKTWLKTVLNIPFGKYKPFPVKASDPPEKINEYFKKVRGHLDSKVFNLDYVKDEIMEYLARKITNPRSKGHILALAGAPGVGKTRLLKTLGEALDLPFYQVNFGGLNDSSILTGHSETYVGSKPGKFVEFLQNSGCMNPIMYFDEIDKIASNKEQEINGILTHILDEEQNSKFQDNYLSNVPIDLSKVFFVIAFNDFEKVDRIVSDRLKVIYITSPTMDDKMNIARDKMIPDIIESFNFKKDKYINLDNELLSYIINNKVPKEEGVRQLRKSLEKIFSKLNYYILTGEYENHKEYFKMCVEYEENVCKNVINIKRNFIDKCLESKEENMSHMMMYV